MFSPSEIARLSREKNFERKEAEKRSADELRARQDSSHVNTRTREFKKRPIELHPTLQKSVDETGERLAALVAREGYSAISVSQKLELANYQARVGGAVGESLEDRAARIVAATKALQDAEATAKLLENESENVQQYAAERVLSAREMLARIVGVESQA